MTDAESGRPRTDPRRRIWSIAMWVVAGVIVVAALAGFTAFSETSGFCPTCHEMEPYYAAWKTGPHSATAECVDCHVDAGLVAHIAHKPSELVEVYDHFFADKRYPNYNVDLSNARCLRCHPRVEIRNGSRFSHALHETQAQCKECHATTGHEVSLESLRAAGVLKSEATTPPVPAGMRPTIAAGHKVVVCQKCHDQAKMKCSACHAAPHESRGDCTNCHQPGDRFVFVHPVTGADCSRCHQMPANHPSAKGACATCHQQPGTGWAFKHPVSSTDCAACHQPPAPHFGPACASCHSPRVPFAQATFNHPSNTGEHDWRSLPCARCHPDGYTSVSCTCHGGKAPQGD